jgi:hypothetical protein
MYEYTKHNNIKMGLTRGCRLNYSGPRYGLVARYFVHCNEPLILIEVEDMFVRNVSTGRSSRSTVVRVASPCTSSSEKARLFARHIASIFGVEN